MPELPEVETVVRHIGPLVSGRSIEGFTAHWHKVTAPETAERFAAQVTGQRIETFVRRGKFILLQLEHGWVHIHLRMTGQLLVADNGQKSNAHIRASFDLSGMRSLLFKDTRKFGRIGYLNDLAILMDKLGPEPLESSFTPHQLANMLHGSRRQVKPLLLDQSFIAGLGNIYVDEALFRARIHPATAARAISTVKAHRLHRAIQEVLTESIRLKGTTFRSFRFGADQSGEFRQSLQIFGRMGEPCPNCGTKISKIRIAQRGTHFCGRCQRKIGAHNS
ncbi:MAG: bifunctional DNA-formamidopyrimidine glycosylase/DNA-(apurinic or apyrimidinic site) lyase [Candidatus Marinimicrobia bacterium]|nr:bifunctional DNA-formamidopyrimidine glycosylase/DNA-(apurinic or apyrimidinic site) lyase [Candidatus Neomarinimicrobiota bacterium]